jgi:glucokinase
MEEEGRGEVLKGVDALTPQMIAKMCEQGDEAAIEAFHRTGLVLGKALATYASLVDPESIILTGDMTAYGKWMMDVMKETFEANIFQNLKGKVSLVISPLNNSERDILGASALAWEVKEYSLFK